MKVWVVVAIWVEDRPTRGETNTHIVKILSSQPSQMEAERMVAEWNHYPEDCKENRQDDPEYYCPICSPKNPQEIHDQDEWGDDSPYSTEIWESEVSAP